MDQSTDASGSGDSKECKGNNSRHPSFPCEFLLRAKYDKKLHFFIFHDQKYYGKHGITINMFCGYFLKFLLRERLVSHEILPFLFFSFLFGIFAVSLYTPMIMVTRPINGMPL